MFTFLILVAAAAVMGEHRHPALDQALLSPTNRPVDLLSVSNGAPVTYAQTKNAHSTNFVRNAFYMELMTQFNREKTSGRSVHMKGTGAFGYFEVTHDISHICKAKLFNRIGKKTPIAVRFSPAATEKGASDLVRGANGFAVKFYTEDGILDLPGFNVPMFFMKDPGRFREFVYSLRKDPALYLRTPMKLWESILTTPEAINMFLLVFSDRGITKNYRQMPGYNIHTLQVYNEQDDQHFVRFTFTPDAGIEYMTNAEALAISDLDYYIVDLFNAIKKGDFPSWTVSVQIVTEDDVRRLGYALFDVTRELPLDKFPLHPVGKIILNRNPKNHFAEIEQIAFCPGNLVDGFHGAPDKVFEARKFSYVDAALVRLGRKYKEIPVNCPCYSINYNSSRETISYQSTKKTGMIKIQEFVAPSNFDQAAEFYENGMSSDEQTRCVENIIFALTPASESLRAKVIDLFTTIHSGLGNRIAQGFNITVTK